MRRMNAKVTGIAITAVLSTFLTACGGGHSTQSDPPMPVMPQKCTNSGPVVFVVSGRQNSPTPALTGAMSTAARTAIEQGSPIGLIDLDGKPRLTMAGRFNDPGVNSAAKQNDEQNYFAQLTSAVESTRAKFPHADMLDALDQAGRAARAGCSYGGTIYVEDSGLEEAGPVNFYPAGMLDAAPSDIVAFLKGQHELPSHLRGLKVVFAGLGDTASPQPSLSIAQQANVIAIWTAIANAAGATSVVIDPAPRNGISAPPHVPPVLVVPVPAVSSTHGPGGTTTTSLPDTLLFPFGSSTLIASAGALLRPIAEQARNQHQLVSITGYASPDGGTYAYNLALSQRRAIAVRDRLIALGLPIAEITHVTGVGTAGQRQNSCLMKGHLDEARCELLRRVVITLSPAAT